jgi:UDP-3-O-[3-hydroxymyristoyl] N-acetylglucosamine deacetylase
VTDRIPNQQHTLKTAIHCQGVGLHGGKTVRLDLRPAAVDTGITFIRSDVGRGGVIAGRFDAVVDTKLCTVLGNAAGARVGTVEHLLAALRGCGVDNAEVHVDADEVPILDGSSEPWVFLIHSAGIVAQGASRRTLRILRQVSASEGTASATLLPGEGCAFSFEIDFDADAIGRQRYRMALDAGAFDRELANCRTFCRLGEVETLRRMGLALGGSLENAVVVDGGTILNPEGLRRPDEFVRHKILDAVGDLYLAGAGFEGQYQGHKAGHRLNNLLLRAVFADARNYEWVTADVGAGLLAAELPGRLATAAAI